MFGELEVTGVNELELLDLSTLVAQEGLAEMLADAAQKFNDFKLEVMAKFADKYPQANFGDKFFMDYRRVLRECAVCETCTGYPCKKEINDGFRYYVGCEKRLNEMVVSAYICPYKESQQTLKKAGKQFANAKIPALYVGKTFSDYKVDAANELAVKWAHAILENEKYFGQSVYFTGNPGTGKTFLVSIIAQEFLKRGQSVIFSDVPGMLNAMRASFSKSGEDSPDIEEMINTLNEAEVLIMDDFGTELATEWAASRLYDIINFRYANKKQILVTSNYSLDELADRLNTPTKGKGGVTGDRIASRLKGMCKISYLRGEDRRI